MKVIITKHAAERRKKGFIPKSQLEKLVKGVYEQNKESFNEDGLYKFSSGGARGILVKKKCTYILVTFFGSTGWLIEKEDDDFSNFGVRYLGKDQEDAQQRKIEARKKKPLTRKQLKRKAKLVKEPSTKCLTRWYKDKLKKGTFEMYELPEKFRVSLKEEIGHNPWYVFICKEPAYIWVEVLNIDGKFLKRYARTKDIYFIKER